MNPEAKPPATSAPSCIQTLAGNLSWRRSGKAFMSASGQKGLSSQYRFMSALPTKADITACAAGRIYEYTA